ncbi:hypothetical protein ABZ128_09555 [Streptomyces sp. NPDC006326]|uniref:hypothetical protein n=1 Tax=Streptomyces sp. NPDC006326 TaxID=3156752 RepID=UPI0033BB9FE0
MIDLEHESTEALVARGIASLKRHQQISGEQTVLLRNVARVLVEMRRRTGNWGGRGKEYRDFAARIYSGAGIAPDSLDSVQAAVRYHIGNILREVATPEELEDHKLQPLGPSERWRVQQKSRTAVIASARAEIVAAEVIAKAPAKTKGKKQTEQSSPPAPPVGSLVADHIRLATGVASILSQLSTDVIDGMTDGQRARLDAQLEAAQKTLTKLRRHSRRKSEA